MLLLLGFKTWIMNVYISLKVNYCTYELSITSSAIFHLISPRRLNLQRTREALDICFKVFTNDTEYRSLTRRAVIDKVCLVLLRATSTSVVREFYVDNIKKIMEIVECRFTKVWVALNGIEEKSDVLVAFFTQTWLVFSSYRHQKMCLKARLPLSGVVTDFSMYFTQDLRKLTWTAWNQG